MLGFFQIENDQCHFNDLPSMKMSAHPCVERREFEFRFFNRLLIGCGPGLEPGSEPVMTMRWSALILPRLVSGLGPRGAGNFHHGRLTTVLL